MKARMKCKKCREPLTDCYGVMVCSRGCDYKIAREAERRYCEEVTGCVFGEPILVMDGLTIIADGYEEPYIRVRMGGKEMILGEAKCQVLYSALYKALDWCEKGWCPGSC